MTLAHRVLYPEPVTSLQMYCDDLGGGEGIRGALAVPASTVIAEVEASGLRGRGGAGFPTGTKWRAVAENESDVVATSVVVNGAEGEPGTFKDRTILRNNPYQVIEGALIAARAVGATEVVFALKRSFGEDIARLRAALDEARAVGWAAGVQLSIFEGPGEYLFGEETALLEVIEGRPPFPRIAPPYRRGAVDVVDDDDTGDGSGQAARVEMAYDDDENLAPPALVDNVETLANVPRILARGAAWFRTEGTDESPGTIVCTITGRVRTPGVGEVMLGTTLRDAIDEIAGGPIEGHTLVAAMPGVSNALIAGELLDTPLTYEAMTAAGSGLGSGGFIVLDDTVDPVAAVAGASRFLAVESCGQCTPCKQDGVALGGLLARLARSEATEADVEELRGRTATVAEGARCNLARQQEALVGGLLTQWAPAVEAHIRGTVDPVEPMLVAELLDFDEEGAVVDAEHLRKQPDWSYADEDSGASPADAMSERRAVT